MGMTKPLFAALQHHSFQAFAMKCHANGTSWPNICTTESRYALTDVEEDKMMTKHATPIATAILLSLTLITTAGAAEPALQFGAALNLGAFDRPAQPFENTANRPAPQPPVGLLAFNQADRAVGFPMPSRLQSPADAVQSAQEGGPAGEAEHGTLVLAGLLMIGMVVSKRMMR